MDPALSRDEYRALRGDPRRWHDAIVAIAARHGLAAEPVQPLGGSNLVASIGGTRVVKLFPPFLRYQWDSERVALAVLHGALAPVVTPELRHVGELDGWPYLVMTRLEGASLVRDPAGHRTASCCSAADVWWLQPVLHPNPSPYCGRPYRGPYLLALRAAW